MNLELAVELIMLGREQAGDDLVDPSVSEVLRRAGNAPVTVTIERLSERGLVRDAGPLFGADGGMWIGYRLTEDGHRLAGGPDEIRRAFAADVSGFSELRRAFEGLATSVEESTRDRPAIGDLVATIREIGVCFDAGCHIATVVLAGKLLEICLREELLDHLPAGSTLEENLGIGALLQRLRDVGEAAYRAENMNNVANLVKSARNAAAHARNESVPVPSRDQAASVAYAVRDVAIRRLERGG